MPGVAVVATPTLTGADSDAVEGLLAGAAAVDGFEALNEAGRLRLRHAREGTTHLLVRSPDGVPVGYAQLGGPADGSGAVVATGELVVDPGHRGRGIGSALLAELLARGGPGLRLWAMRDTPPARRLAVAYRLHPVRELLLMRRTLEAPLPAPPLPAGVAIRAFEPGRDDDAWLAVNARAFADHPEQGGITAADLAERMAEPWFDPAGFLLAERGGELVGFHWTKRHPDGVGEVYVLGVDPGAAGAGLGSALLVAGLGALHAAGSRAVVLYVEAAHDRAVRLYRGYGFEVAARDVMYAPDPRSTRVDPGG